MSILIEINLLEFFENFVLVLNLFVTFGNIHFELFHANLVIAGGIDVSEKSVTCVYLFDEFVREMEGH